MEEKTPPPPNVKAAVDRIIAGSTFAHNDALASLLRYVVEKAASGHAGEIKEYTIALEVFGRSSYDAQIDSLVRVQAARLRKRLATYYETEGGGDPVRIEIPKGSYVPTFHEVLPVKPPESGRRLPLGVITGIVVAALIAIAAYRWLVTPRPVPQPAPTPSIAVLPFVDLSPSKDKEYLCEGLTEELITSLSGLSGLRVASSTSVSQFRAPTVDVRHIGEVLKVQAVLEGSLRIEGSRIRVIAQLVNTRDGFHLWARTYERDLAEPSDIQHEIADSIFRDFRTDLLTTRRALVRPPSPDVEAWHHYVRAAYISSNEPLNSVEFYQAAVTADPDYALAWAGMSLAWVMAVDWGEAKPADVLPKAAAAARRALAIDATLAEAQQAVARVKVFCEQDWTGAERALRRAIELDPTYLEARLDYVQLVLIPTGRFDQAVEELQRALALYPDTNLYLNQLANAYIKARQYGKAFEPLESSQKIRHRQLAVWVYLGVAANGLGDHEQALQRFQKAASIRRTAWVLGHLGFAYAKLGRRADAVKVIA